MRVRIVRHGLRLRNLFVPLILLWPLALIVALLLLPLLAIIALFRPRGVLRILKAAARLAALFCTMRGLHLEIRKASNNILLYLR